MDELGGGGGLGEEEEEEEEEVNPLTLKPDLYTAAQQNDTARVLELLEGEVPPTFVDDVNGWTPLHWAAKNGNVVLLSGMLKKGASAPYHRMVVAAKEAAKREEEARKKDKEAARVGFAAGAAADQPSSESKGGEGDAGAGTTDDSIAAGSGVEGEPFSAAVGEDVEGATGADNAGADNAAAAAAAAAGAALSASAAASAEPYGEDDDEDDIVAVERRLETSVNLVKNTPLLWACVKGHLDCVWLLLVDGYSPNDVDDMGNNALHLAAAAGNRKVVKTLIDDGVKSTLVNIYKNLPIDMATDKEVREAIFDAMQKGASMTQADIDLKHDACIRVYNRMINSLQSAVGKAKDLLDSLSKSGAQSSSTLGDALRVLADAIRIGKEWSLDQELLTRGQEYVVLLEATQELLGDIAATEKEFPFRTQGQYTQHIRKIELAVDKAEGLAASKGGAVSEKIISQAKHLVQRAQIEYWISTISARLDSLEMAMDHNEHDMNKLKAAIIKGQVQNASEEILQEASTLHKKLESELGMTRALQSFPTYKLPWTHATDPPPDNYYTENDFGRVKETEEYPNPPADTGEYIWEPSVTYSSLQSCISKLKEAFGGAGDVGANPALVAEAKTKLTKAEKDFKLIHLKEENDKLAAIEETKKKIKKKPAPKKKG
jgi:hypothetical protein